jgi:ABC-type multidrug transport system ATPase subunit
MKLIINQLSKTYPNGVQALKNINLEIGNGMFGLLGPNGAGKSSLMRTLATLQDADSGTALLDNIDIGKQKTELRKVLGYLPQEFGVYPRVSAEEMLNHLAILKGITKSAERKEIVKALLQQVNLYEKRKKNLGSYSGGMKQRFGIAQALLGNPRLIIVDEPTAGLDPAERIRFNNLLSEIGENIIVILSTHIVDDVNELCNDMAIISNGEVLLKGNPNRLTGDMEGKVWSKRIRKEELPEYRQKYNIIYSRLASGGLKVHVLSDASPEESFISERPNLEDVYFSRMNIA